MSDCWQHTHKRCLFDCAQPHYRNCNCTNGHCAGFPFTLWCTAPFTFATSFLTVATTCVVPPQSGSEKQVKNQKHLQMGQAGKLAHIKSSVYCRSFVISYFGRSHSLRSQLLQKQIIKVKLEGDWNLANGKHDQLFCDLVN